MNSLEKLQAKVTELVAKFETIQAEKTELEVECAQLREQAKGFEQRIRTLTSENGQLSKALQTTNDAALKRISKIVDRIDQVQAELKIS
jgi:predicted nuclease with TOPRIM domain